MASEAVRQYQPVRIRGVELGAGGHEAAHGGARCCGVQVFDGDT